MRHPITLFLFLMLLLVSPAIGDSWRLMDRSFDLRTLRPVQLGATSISGLDTDDQPLTIPVADITRLTRLGVSPPDATLTPAIDLADGQLLRGTIRPTQDGEGIVVDHPGLGRLIVPLASVRAMRLMPLPAPIVPPDGFDRIILTNGDELDGTLITLVADKVRFLTPGAEEPLDLPLSAIAAIVRAVTPPEPPSLDRLTLLDGTIIDAQGVTLARGLWSLRPILGTRTTQLPAASVFSIDLRRQGLRLVSLTDLPMRETRPADVFGITLGSSRDHEGFRLHAPAAVAFDLPENTLAVTLRLELDPSIPQADLHWPSMIANLAIGSARPRSVEIDAQTPEHIINLVAESPGLLTIDLDAGQHGPVLDRLLIRDAEVLLASPRNRRLGL
ncbi:MAG: hypothetical protein RIG82_07750 [Phycisphaeraceae bacterium]